ncbi:MAG TPA: hypothetical protein VD713_07885 [Sphingomonadales bacterium]|nr:hypothetical protein [Sphingomonadales bacterium]
MTRYEISYGSKYDKEATTTEIAKRLRADIKAAQKSGGLPKGLKVSVRSSYFSMGSSIDIRVKACPFPFLNLERLLHDTLNPREFVPETICPVYTEAGSELLKKLQGMMNAYNYDGSDIQTDYYNVNFYGHAEFDHDLTHSVRKALLA